MVLRSARELVGPIGCHTGRHSGYPAGLAPGGIEFGCTVFEPVRRRGLAVETLEALMRWAREEYSLTRFVVSICPENSPSLTASQTPCWPR